MVATSPTSVATAGRPAAIASSNNSGICSVGGQCKDVEMPVGALRVGHVPGETEPSAHRNSCASASSAGRSGCGGLLKLRQGLFQLACVPQLLTAMNVGRSSEKPHTHGRCLIPDVLGFLLPRLAIGAIGSLVVLPGLQVLALLVE